MTTEWIVFWAVVAGALAVDLRFAKKSNPKSAAVWSAVWIGLGLAFGAWIALRLGGEAGITYLTAYVLEKSLSVDNLFVFILIFSLTGIPANLQHRALFWGIVGALVMRAALIAVGDEAVLRHNATKSRESVMVESVLLMRIPFVVKGGTALARVVSESVSEWRRGRL